MSAARRLAIPSVCCALLAFLLTIPASAGSVGLTATIQPSALTEGTGGASYTRQVTVTLSAPAPSTVTVNVIAETGTADASDFSPFGGPVAVNFTTGQFSKTFDVLINPDALHEDNEYFLTRITSTTGADYSLDSVQQEITNDDLIPEISIGDVTEPEGTDDDPVDRDLTVPITLNHPSETDITVTFVSADGTATVADGDYTGFTAHTITIFANSVVSNQLVNVFTDFKHELNESFTLSISNPSGATIADGSATITLTNDDAVPTLTVEPVDDDIDEGTGAGSTLAEFTVSLSNPTYQNVTFDWTTVNDEAIAPDDYAASNANDVTMAAGVTDMIIGPPVVRDAIFEDDEALRIEVSDVHNATPATTLPMGSFLELVNDDGIPSVTVTGYTSTEGTPVPPDIPACTFQLDMTLTLSNPTELLADVTLTVAEISATLADNDFELPIGSLLIPPPPTMTFTFPPGETQILVALASVCDDHIEPDESFTATITSVTNVTVGSAATATFNILNDDFVDLMVDSGFENDGSDLRQGLNKNWILTNKTGDKVKCYTPDSTVQYRGLCDFEFKGSVGENAQLSQIVDNPEMFICPSSEDRSTFAVLLSVATQGGENSKLSYKVMYWDSAGKHGDIKQPIIVGATWSAFVGQPKELPEMPLKMKLVLTHKSKKGKTRIDEVHLYCGDTDHFRSDAPSLLPPPAAPDGFRGGN